MPGPDNTHPLSADRTADGGPGHRRAVGGEGSLFISADALAERLGVSRNLIVDRTSRGELHPVRIGSRVLYPWPEWQLKALGVDGPVATGLLMRGLGLTSINELLAFLSGDGEVGA